MKKLWKDLQIGDVFKDGSIVKSIHQEYEDDTYKITYKGKKQIVLSQFHLLLCNINHLNKDCKLWVKQNFSNYKIPTLFDKHIYMDKHSCSIEQECYNIIESDNSQISDNEYWLPVKALNLLINNFHQKIYCNNILLKKIEYFGVQKVFCVETDSHKFETCDLIHHNSVTLRNIIFHCLSHGEQISIALIDLKYTEFTPFKEMKNVVAVANTVKEAVEILRLARECMYKRNQELAKIGINDIKDFKPQKPTDEVIVAGRKLKDDTLIEIRLPNGEEKTITVKELENYL